MSNPLQPMSPSAPRLTVPAAYRAWALTCNTQGFGGMQVARIRASDADESATALALLEVFQRATFETALALHFDGTDTMADVEVFRQIGELFGTRLAARVLDMAAANGPVCRSLGDIGTILAMELVVGEFVPSPTPA